MSQQQRIQGQQSLTLDEQNLRARVETIPAPVWRAKPDSLVDYRNKRLHDYFR
jgi:hypothetical protein